MPLKVSQRPFW